MVQELIWKWTVRSMTLLAVGFMTIACVAEEGLKLWPVDYEFVDEPSKRRISLTYENPHSFPVCMLPETFPKENGGGFEGVRPDGRERMKLIIDGEDFYPIGGLFEYCPGGCERRVEPGEKVTGHVSYSAFSLPRALYPVTKELEFKTVTYACD